MIQLITHKKGYNPIQAKVTLNQGNCYITKLFFLSCIIRFYTDSNTYTHCSYRLMNIRIMYTRKGIVLYH